MHAWIGGVLFSLCYLDDKITLEVKQTYFKLSTWPGGCSLGCQYFIPGNMIMPCESSAFSFSLILMINSIKFSCEQKSKLIIMKLWSPAQKCCFYELLGDPIFAAFSTFSSAYLGQDVLCVPRAKPSCWPLHFVNPQLRCWPEITHIAGSIMLLLGSDTNVKLMSCIVYILNHCDCQIHSEMELGRSSYACTGIFIEMSN